MKVEMDTVTVEKLLTQNRHLSAQVNELQDRMTQMVNRQLSRRVRQFHTEMGIPVAHTPGVPDEARVRFRLRLIAEEFSELVGACLQAPIDNDWKELLDAVIDNAPVNVDFPEAVDALADLDYVIEGTRAEFGVLGDMVMDAVHAANMAKVGGPVRESDGKQLKPEGWQPPDIEGVLRWQGWRG